MLPPREVAALLAAKHKPGYCLQVLSETLRAAQQAAQAGPGTPPIPKVAALR